MTLQPFHCSGTIIWYFLEIQTEQSWFCHQKIVGTILIRLWQ